MLSENEKNIPEEIIEDMISYLYMNGMYMKSEDLKGIKHLNLTVYPSPIPKNLYDKIIFYQIAFNKIFLRLSLDQEFIEKILEPIAKDEAFIKNNLEISKKVAQFEQRCKINFDIFRNDFMVDKKKKFAYQIEYNTIASSMGVFSDKIKNFYTHFSEKYPSLYQKYLNNKHISIPFQSDSVISNMTSAMIEAIKLFSPDNYTNTIIIFVVQATERNVFDQKPMENELYNKYGVKSRRMTFEEILKNCHKDEEQNIFDENNNMISLFYFRAGYTDRDYPNEDCWKARELIELSTAVKCPNINLYLITCKVFQSELSKEEIMSKYMNSDLIRNDLKRFFLEISFMRDLNTDERVTLLTKVLGNCENYIIKPQKEGGGNNYSGEAIKKVILSVASEPTTEIKDSIIMEIINPPSHENIFLKEGKPVVIENTVSEFSTYGIMLSKENEIVLNKSTPFLVRSKSSEQKEGGIIVGVGGISIPCLLEMEEAATEEIDYKKLI